MDEFRCPNGVPHLRLTSGEQVFCYHCGANLTPLHVLRLLNAAMQAMTERAMSMGLRPESDGGSDA